MRAPTSTVIVVSYKPGEWLRPCLDSVTAEADEVVLVDNGSPDREASAIGAAAGVRVHRLACNEGFVGGVNAGVDLVGTELVALLNDDALAEGGWLASAAAVLDDPTVAAVGPKVLLAGDYAEVRLDAGPWWAPGDPRPLGTRITTATAGSTDVLASLVGGVHRPEHDGAARWRWTNGYDPLYVPLPGGCQPGDVRLNAQAVPEGWVGGVVNNAGVYLSQEGHGGDYGYESADKGGFDSPAEHFGVTGAAMVTRKATFERVGPLAPGFFAYYEDVDWSWRARLAGYRLMYDPAGVVHHVRSATAGDLGGDFVTFLAQRNRLLCLLRNAPAGTARREVTKALRHHRTPGLAAALGRAAPAVATGRLRSPNPGRYNRVWDAWAGRDETWGLASQLDERSA